MPRRARLSSNSVMVAAVVVAVATFGLGFLAAYESGQTVEVAETPTVPLSTVGPRPTSDVTAPTSTTPPTTVVPSTIPLTTPDTPTTLIPQQTSVVTIPPSSAPPPTAAPTSAPRSPGVLVVSFNADQRGRLHLTAGVAGAIGVKNTGGSDISFSIEGAGAVTVGATGVANGVLRPGEGRAISVVPTSDPPPGPGPHATIAVFSAAGLVQSIQVVIS